MKMLSLNIRGFGGEDKEGKLNWVRKLCRVEKPDVIFIQETKLHTVDLRWIRRIWGNNNCNFIQKAMVGKSGGQLIIWDVNRYEATDPFVSNFFIGLRGKWKVSGECCNLINVYGPHKDANKKRLWEQLTNVLENCDSPWIIGGDFNEVREQDDRFNCNFIEYRARWFNKFIEENKLIDLPIGGRKYM
ncbi:uncharacterized protein [Rutidosis leptorrhynchoides]|uniref:uncharacterized protein n=1 Tax=Rutidosis leptorrhynchoides TaxID=125765 RepID=UPI003A992CEA